MTLVTNGEQVIPSPVSSIRVIRRITQGVRRIALSPGDKLIGMSRILDVQER
jgi:DNA gyrase/topoisomerase IV subunit A